MTNYANSLRKLTMTTAVTAFMAAPIAAMAQTADVGAGADVNAGVSADVAGSATGADVAAGADSTVSTDTGLSVEDQVAETIPAETETDVDIALDGSTVAVASDDTVIGTISDAEPQADGSVRYSIDLAEDFAVDSDRAVVQIEQEVDAEGQLVIGMTGDEFAAALTQQINAGGADPDQLRRVTPRAFLSPARRPAA